MYITGVYNSSCQDINVETLSSIVLQNIIALNQGSLVCK